MRVFFSIGLKNSMFGTHSDSLSASGISWPEVEKYVNDGLVYYLDESDRPAVDALNSKYGTSIEIPKTRPDVCVEGGDTIIVAEACGLPKLSKRRKYTDDEIDAVSFLFRKYMVSWRQTGQIRVF